MNSYFLIRLDTICFDIVLITPFILGFRFPNLLQTLSIEISKEKYKNSQLKGLDVDAVIKRLIDLQEIEKMFLNPELKIEDVSEELNISKHQLSEILNNNMGLHFMQFINQYRIEEAKRLLLEIPEETILQIAYSVGFNSKTSFNTIFKKKVGKTPTEHRISSNKQ